MPEALVCPNCKAPLRIESTQVLTTCQYCGYQIKQTAAALAVSAPAAGPHLIERIGLAVKGARTVLEILAAGTTLPVEKRELLSTVSDNQETMTVTLVSGNSDKADENRPLAEIVFPVRQRAPRGVVKITLALRVGADGKVSLSLVEEGTDNRLERHDLSVAVAS